MTAIIALSGKKQAGKSTLADYLRTLIELETAGVDYDNVVQKSDGTIMIDAHGVELENKQFLETLRDKNAITVRLYSFADALKEFCVDVLGLRPEQVYGTDEQKNTPTEISWETMPDYVRWRNGTRTAWPKGHSGTLIDGSKQVTSDKTFTTLLFAGWAFGGMREGMMTAREVMQVFGTDIMRNMFTDRIWVNATFRRIQKDNPRVALIADLRFPSEMQALQTNNGFIIRLDRSITNQDQHPSEVALDDWDWNKTPRCLRIPNGDIATRNKIARDWMFGSVLSGEKSCLSSSNAG